MAVHSVNPMFGGHVKSVVNFISLICSRRSPILPALQMVDLATPTPARKLGDIGMKYWLPLALLFGWVVGSSFNDSAGRPVGMQEGGCVFGGACSGTQNCGVESTCSENCGQADRSRSLASGTSKADYCEEHQCLKGNSNCLRVNEAYGCDVSSE